MSNYFDHLFNFVLRFVSHLHATIIVTLSVVSNKCCFMISDSTVCLVLHGFIFDIDIFCVKLLFYYLNACLL